MKRKIFAITPIKAKKYFHTATCIAEYISIIILLWFKLQFIVSITLFINKSTLIPIPKHTCILIFCIKYKTILSSHFANNFHLLKNFNSNHQMQQYVNHFLVRKLKKNFQNKQF